MNTPRSLTLIKFFLPFLLLAAFVFSAPPSMAAATGSGRVITEARAVSDFNAITMKGSMKLEVRQTGRESLSITADDNILPLIETKVEADGSDRVLHIQFKRDASVSTRREIKVVIEVIKLSPALKLTMLGAGDVNARGLVLDALNVRIAGSGDAAVHATKSLTVGVMGSGDVQYRGGATEIHKTVMGSGSVKPMK